MAAYAGVSFPLGGASVLLGTRGLWAQLVRGSHMPRLLVLGERDQFTRLGALRDRVRDGGGHVLPDDYSSQEAGQQQGQEQGPAAPAAAPAAVAPAAAAAPAGPSGGGGGGAAWGRAALSLKIYPGEDHFWTSECARMCAFVVDWLVAHGGAADPGPDPT